MDDNMIGVLAFILCYFCIRDLGKSCSDLVCSDPCLLKRGCIVFILKPVSSVN